MELAFLLSIAFRTLYFWETSHLLLLLFFFTPCHFKWTQIFRIALVLETFDTVPNPGLRVARLIDFAEFNKELREEFVPNDWLGKYAQREG